MLLTALSVILLVASASTSCIVPSLVHLKPEYNCSFLNASGQTSLELHMQRAESEAVIIAYEAATNVTGLKVTVEELPEEVTAQSFVMGYIFTTATTRYDGSGGGWRSDPLFPTSSTGIDVKSGDLQGFWVEFTTTLAASPATTNVTIIISDGSGVLATFTCQITVHPVTVPTLADSTIGTAWSGTWSSDAAPNVLFDKMAYFDLMLSHRMPPDSIYHARNFSDYQIMQQAGAQHYAILNINTALQKGSGPVTENVSCSRGTITDDMLNTAMDTLDDMLTKLKAESALGPAYVYGWDEYPDDCENQVRFVYGAIKAKYPNLTLVATLNWKVMPADLPVDVWVLQYEEFSTQTLAPWIAAGKKQWQYHCIEPAQSTYLNTFIERPFVEARLLMWLAAANQLDYGAPSGWLYYAMDLWRPYPGKTIEAMTTLDNTAYTNYSAANYIWSPRTDIFANGDGYFMYPGADGKPIRSARLAGLRDGLEDWELFQRLNSSHPLRAIVQSPTEFTLDVEAVSAARTVILNMLDEKVEER